MSISLKQVTYSYNTNFSVNIDLNIKEGNWVVIVGKSGAGKTTLLKLIAGILTPDTGEVEFAHDDVEIGFIFQNPDDQILQVSLEKELAFNLENNAMPMENMRVLVEQALSDYHFDGREKSSPNALSGGEKQRLALAATLISNPDVLIFDEPTSFLDYIQKEKLYQKVSELKSSGKTVIWSSHELDEIMLADFVIEMDNGAVIFSGEREDYLKKLFQRDFISEYLNED